MGDPERLLKSGSADPRVRELLQSLQGISPEAGLGLGSWGAMSAKVATLPTIVPALGSAPTTAGGAAASGNIGASASKVLGLKLLAVALASTVIGVGVYWAHTGNSKPNRAPSAAAVTLPVLPAASAPVVANLTDQDTAEPSPAPQNGANPQASAAHPSRLDAEASMLAKVRSQLRSGDAHAALVSLNQLQSKFPNGQLGQERDVLAVEVLAANGNLTAAKRKASAFIAAHPTSPLSAKLERFVAAR